MIGVRSKEDVAALFAQGAADPEVFGDVPVFFYITPKDSWRFAGKVVAFAEDRWFFIRDP